MCYYAVYLDLLGLTSAGCVSGNTTYVHGSRWTENGCLECECHDGTTSCTRLPVCSQSAESVVSLFDCSFEDGMCDWINDDNGDVEWERNRGPTLTPNTGPDVDHTLGSALGYYLYMESSQPNRPGYRAILLGPPVDSQNLVFGIQFWYHMYGRHTGPLTVSVRFSSGDERELWHLEGDQGNQWHRANIRLPSGEDLGYRVVFTAERTKGFLGDVSIDDISWISYPGLLASHLYY